LFNNTSDDDCILALPSSGAIAESANFTIQSGKIIELSYVARTIGETNYFIYTMSKPLHIIS
jgi:hypothetical protein